MRDERAEVGAGVSGSSNGAVQRMTAEEEEIIRDRLEQLGYIE
jgi:hypothetical protein